eukprot:Clim_evm17s172 gene=Clim_evmTU17s172
MPDLQRDTPPAKTKVTNGSAQQNGTMHANGDTTATPLSERNREVVRLIVQYLNSIGLSPAARQVEEDSGQVLEPEVVTKFRNSILNGHWTEALDLLDELKITEARAKKAICFMVYEQKYLELIDSGDLKGGLQCIRHELAPVCTKPSRLHELSSFMMSKDRDKLHEKANWDGPDGESRKLLLQNVQKYISPELMVPENRLMELLQQAIDSQTARCTYHNTSDSTVSLLKDHRCDQRQVPNQCIHVLKKHNDEVWMVKFSPNGKLLASASKDGKVVLWDCENNFACKAVASANTHHDAIQYIAWSPGSDQLLTCGGSEDKSVRLWTIGPDGAKQKRKITKHLETLTACAWLPCGTKFVTGGNDKHVYLWDVEQEEPIHTWTSIRPTDIAVTHSGDGLIMTCQERRIRCVKLSEPYNETMSVAENGNITSLCLSKNDCHVLVNITDQEVHLWDLKEGRLTQKYYGHSQERFVIRSCFGGYNEVFVVSGSEDSKIYIWHRHHAHLLKVLSGHKAPVNCVAWSPTNHLLFASASDDKMVRIWGVGSSDNSEDDDDAQIASDQEEDGDDNASEEDSAEVDGITV